MRIDFLAQLGRDRCAVLVANTFRNGDHATSELGVDPLDVPGELVFVERTLGQIDEVWTVAGVNPRQGRCRGEKAGVTSHDDIDLHPGQGAVVEVVTHEGFGDKARPAAESGRVVVLAQIVVDRLRDVKALQQVIVRLGFLVDDVRGLGRVVAADVKEITDVVFLQDMKDGKAVVLGRLFAHRTKAGGRRLGHRFERRGALLAQVDEVLAQNPGNTMERAVNVFDLPVLLRLEDGADETLVDDHGRSAALGDDHVADRSFAFSHN